MIKPMVYVVIKVFFDHCRFEEYLGTFFSMDAVNAAIKEDDQSYSTIESVEPNGANEYDGVGDHYWVIPTEIPHG